MEMNLEAGLSVAHLLADYLRLEQERSKHI
jgi:hypothetical protein